jgi:uncharacterized protein YjbI with pentapeptide repeats
MTAFKYAIKNRWTGAVIFEAEIGAEYSGQSDSVKLGIAVKIAVKARANLVGANLVGANLAGASLARANLADAFLAGANLAGVNLAGASLAGAKLAGANLAGASLARANLADAKLAGRIIDGGIRADGYRFLLTRTEPGEWRVKAGCRNFTLAEAREHWGASYGRTELGAEALAIIDHMVALAELREWPKEGEALDDYLKSQTNKQRLECTR